MIISGLWFGQQKQQRCWHIFYRYLFSFFSFFSYSAIMIDLIRLDCKVNVSFNLGWENSLNDFVRYKNSTNKQKLKKISILKAFL